MAKATKTQEKVVVAYKVVAPFQDLREHATTIVPKQYGIGDDVSHFTQHRLDVCISRGLVAPSTLSSNDGTGS